MDTLPWVSELQCRLNRDCVSGYPPDVEEPTARRLTRDVFTDYVERIIAWFAAEDDHPVLHDMAKDLDVLASRGGTTWHRMLLLSHSCNAEDCGVGRHLCLVEVSGDDDGPSVCVISDSEKGIRVLERELEKRKKTHV